MKKKLIIFDFDDTLTDNSERDYQSFLHVAETYNLKPIEREVIQNWRRTGKSSNFIIKKLITQETDDLEKYLNCRSKFLSSISSYTNFVSLKNCAIDLLSELTSTNLILVLNSLQPQHNVLLNILEYFDIKHFFKKIISRSLSSSENSFQNRSKLKKSMYQDIMAEFELIDKVDILIIGNLFSDIIPADELNIDSLMIEGSFSFDMSQNHPCKKISKLKNILEFV